MFDLGCPHLLVTPVVVNHFVMSSMRKIVILKMALLGLVRACSLKVNWETEKTGFAALLPFVVFHIPVETKHSEQSVVFLFLTSFPHISASSIELTYIYISYYLIIIT
tara:strand:- start:11 stop:334 length:324 start_codon:yes stop_codon:yes gene_type:complete